MTWSNLDPSLQTFILGLISGLSSGVIITIIAAFLQNRFANKRQQIQLEQIDKNIKLQLLHEDRKKAILRLTEIFTHGKTTQEIIKELIVFHRSLEAEHIPDRIRKLLTKELFKINNFMDEHSPFEEFPEPSDEDVEAMSDEYDTWYRSLPPEERFTHDLEQIMLKTKTVLTKEIRNYIRTLE